MVPSNRCALRCDWTSREGILITHSVSSSLSAGCCPGRDRPRMAEWRLGVALGCRPGSPMPSGKSATRVRLALPLASMPFESRDSSRVNGVGQGAGASPMVRLLLLMMIDGVSIHSSPNCMSVVRGPPLSLGAWFPGSLACHSLTKRGRRRQGSRRGPHSSVLPDGVARSHVISSLGPVGAQVPSSGGPDHQAHSTRFRSLARISW